MPILPLREGPGRFVMKRQSISTLTGGLLMALSGSALSGSALAAGLPDGAGRETVEGTCSACHQTNQIIRSSGYTAEGWRELTSTMIDLSGSAELQGRVLDYLAKHFPPSDNRAATLVPGDRQIAFREWQVPTLGQRSRDPIQAPDGTIWWAGQWANLIGKIDPVTGEMKEYPLPKGAMPHSVLLDAEGKVWYTGNKNGSIGYLDPKTEKITVFQMPDPAARDPHTAIFDDQGILWFTLQHSNMIGRLDPASGDIKLVSAPRAGSRPYGIKIDRDGNPWVACNGKNCLLEVDRESMRLTEVLLPNEATTVRRLDIAGDGLIWYVNSSQGHLGRYDPASGEIKEWPSPSGPKSHPYAIAVIDGIVWYN
ncbi:MAG: cytochrome C, partial [Gammaproteobacteria bacterium]|nr:cytochrome C [Gammaproteobacteria bacterium]